LEALGHEVAVTARDNAQTVELALENWPDAAIIGDPSPKSRTRKALVMAHRIRGLMLWARRFRADIALSHNSYGQIVAARALGLRVVTAMDYEGQPANHLAFRLAHIIVMPEAVPSHVVRRQGATVRKLRRYAGLKEEVYLGDFLPDPSVFQQLGVDRDRDTPIVVLRTAPAKAIYHQHQNRVFTRVLKLVGEAAHVRAIVLARDDEQRAEVAALALNNVTVADRALDSRSLMYFADLVIGAGGTMTREAALLGIPTYSVFAGPRPAVDTWLEDHGKLVHVVDPAAIPLSGTGSNVPTPIPQLRARSEAVTSAFLDAILSVGPTRRTRRHV
jgi:predicted glycosyltransferase